MLLEKNGDIRTFKFEVHVLLNIITKFTGLGKRTRHWKL